MSTDRGTNADWYTTIGDIDVETVEDVDLDELSFEVDTRADRVVIAHETGDQILLDTGSVEAVRGLIADLDQACDVAAQYNKDAATEEDH